MKKVIIVILFVCTLCSIFSLSRELWDLHFQIDLTSLTGFASISGAETDGECFYLTSSLYNEVAKLDLTGNLIEIFNIPNIPFGFEDLTTDGEYFYSSSGSANYIYQMNFDTHTIVSDLITPMTVDGLAYDPNEDGFWITNWQNQQLMLVDRNGIILNQTIITDGANGLTHQTDAAGNNYLWIYSGIYTGGEGVVTQYELPGLIPTGLTYNVTADFPGTHSGGLFFSNEIMPGIEILGGIAKGTTCYLFCYEIGISGVAPGPPTDFTLTADPAGVLDVLISWTNPTFDVNGNPLTELDEMHIYREDELIYTDSNPIIGELTTYCDSTIPSSEMIEYTLNIMNSYGSSSVSDEVWVGADVPAVVTNFYGEQIGSTLDIQLNWENPVTGLHGGPFIDPILGYHLEETGIIHEIIGITDQHIFSVPSPGIYFFSIAPYNAVGSSDYVATDDIIVDITSTDSDLVLVNELSNYPNPFNPSTTIEFNVPQTFESAKIEIYNIKGKKVKKIDCHPEFIEGSVYRGNSSRPSTGLRMTRAESNMHSVVWNGTNTTNTLVSSGIYFYQLKVDGKVQKSRKMILMK